MKKHFRLFLILLSIPSIMVVNLSGQEVESKNSMQLKFSGRIQLQHFYNNKFKNDGTYTYHGFRIRRGRLQVDAKLTPFISAKVQVEARDNSPRLKDAEATLKLFKNYYFRFGQFKVPVWREELRSSGDLFLVERSSAASFLILNLLSARQIGIEVGGDLTEKLSFAINYSNGSGEGISEIEVFILLRDEDRTDLLLNRNNGKMYTGRVDYAFSKALQVGVSGVVNYLGNEIDTLSNEGENTLIAPDFGIYLPSGFELEGGIGFGKISKSFFEVARDQNYTVLDLTGRWKKNLKNTLDQWGGVSAYEIAAGISYIDIDNNEINQRNSYRFGPAIYFGKKTRLQVNAEIVEPEEQEEDIFWRIRSQFTVNF